VTRDEKFRKLTSTDAIRGDLRSNSVRAAASTGAAGAVDFAIRIGSTAVLARLILPEQFGLVMMVMAVTAVADQLRDLGLSTATVQKAEISHAEISNLFWVNLTAGLLIAAALCAASPLVSHYYREPRLTAITCVLSSNFIWGGLLVQHQALLTRRLMLGHTSSIRLISSVASTALAIGLAWYGFGVWALVWREVARNGFVAIGMWICFPWIPGLPDRRTSIAGLLHFGSHLAIANIFASLSSGADRLLLGRYWGPAPVAIYRQAYQLLVTPMDQLLAPVYQVSQPGLSMLQAEPDRCRRFYRKVLTVVCIGSMPISLYVAVYAHEITSIVLGKKWEASAPLLMILSIGAFIRQAVGSAAWILITQGRSKTYLGLTTVQGAVVVLLTCAGVPWGPKGVAVANVAATYVLLGPMLHYCLKGSPVTVGMFFGTIARPVFASLAMAAAALAIKTRLAGMAPLEGYALGSVVALAVFPAAWMAMPGGRVELLGLVADVRSMLRRKTGRRIAAEPFPASE
jgi:PST family polysaccharide transporter